MSELINLTPHPIRIYDVTTPDKIDDVNQGLIGVIQPSGKTARVGENDLGTTEWVSYETYTDGAFRIPVELIEYSAIYGLPRPKDGVRLIVPLVTALAALAAGDRRDDFLIPYHQVRNGDGTVVGCRLLAQPC